MSDCNVTKGNLGLSQCNKLPSLPKYMIETPINFAVPAATLASGSAAILAYLQAALLGVPSLRIFLFPPFSSFEDLSEQTVYLVNALKYTFVRDGNYIYKYGISENLCTHKKMFSHRSHSRRVYIIDAEGGMLGTELTNGDFAGLLLNLMNPEKMKINDGANPTESKILVAMANNKELDENGKLLDISSFVGQLYRIVDVDLTQVGSLTTTVITVDVAAECDGTPISGLITADFVVTKASDGTAQTVTAAESATVPGRYTLTGTGLVAGSVNLRAASLLTVKAYESTGAVAVS
jgi:hypothetical protein